MGARVAAANHLGEVLTESEPREAPAQAAYQSLIDEMSRFHAELFQRAMQNPAASAGPPDLTDFQEDFLAAQQELLAMRAKAAATPGGQGSA